MPQIHTVVADLFRVPPSQWALRGDRFLWSAMQSRLEESRLPATCSDLDTILENAFRELTGRSMSDATDFHLEKYSQGGMSSGHISMDFWNGQAKKLLHERFSDLRDPADAVNIFTRYTQKENDFTNGLIALLRLATVDRSELASTLLREVGIHPLQPITTFRVLTGIDGTADAELSGGDTCVLFETKIVTKALDVEQVDRHLDRLRLRPAIHRRLVLLTPDIGESQYVHGFRSIDPELIRHLSWRKVYSLLRDHALLQPDGVFASVVRQYLARIHATVFSQDFAGVIAKIAFGKQSGVDPEAYLHEFAGGEWLQWNTPRNYQELDAPGRMLLLYDPVRKAITVEVEIAHVRKLADGTSHPWENIFAPETLRVLMDPIPLTQIRRVPGFENFGVSGKDRSPYRNFTHNQYERLMATVAENRLSG